MSITFYAARFDPVDRRFVTIDDVEGLNVTNVNARHLATVLRLELDEGELAPLPLDTLLARCSVFLRNTLGKPDPGLAPCVVEGDGGAVLIDAGRPEGYRQVRVRALMDVARAGPARGATHLYGA